jgi:transcription elongation GreA/GreB family factor
MNTANCLNLINEANWGALDDHWMSAIEDGATPSDAMLEVLAAVRKRGEAARAAAMAWMWLTSVKDRHRPEEMVDLAGRVMLVAGDDDQMRTEVAQLYKDVFSEHPGIDALLESSGILGGRTPRRALRTLDLCLRIKPGDYVLSRTEESPAEVIEADPASAAFTIRTREGTSTLDADALATNYMYAEADDFRVLRKLQPERLSELMTKDPAALVVGALKAHNGELTSDDLRYMLTPEHLAADAWTKWWSRARTALKRHPNVRLEGRNPVTLVYDAAGTSLHDEAQRQWSAAGKPDEQIAVIETYLREARARKEPVDSAVLAGWARAVTKDIERGRKHGDPVIGDAIVLERLRQTGHVAADGPSPIEAHLVESSDPATVLRPLAESPLLVQILDRVEAALPDRWADAYLALLPVASASICDELVTRLVAAGYHDRVQELIRQMPLQIEQAVSGVAWMWRGGEVVGQFEIPPREELLGRMLQFVGDLGRSENVDRHAARDARAIVRSALSHRKHAMFREVMGSIGVDLARTYYTSIGRLTGLSNALAQDLRKIIGETFPNLFTVERIDPWDDDTTIYTTNVGREKAETDLAHIMNVKIPENAKAIGEAASHGDLSENSEYKFALEERDLLRARAGRLQDQLSRTRLIEPHIVPRDRVGIGSCVRLKSEDGAIERTVRFLGPWDADLDAGIYNYQAPVSKLLMGLTVGEVARLNLDGTERTYRVEQLESAV